VDTGQSENHLKEIDGFHEINDKELAVLFWRSILILSNILRTAVVCMYVCIPEAGVWFLTTMGTNPLRTSLCGQPTHQGLLVSNNLLNTGP
jgi:hypothetical protein